MSITKHAQDRSVWIRGLYIILFAAIFSLTEFVIWAVVLFQFITRLLTGDTNPQLLDFGQNLSTFVYQIMLFVTFRTDVMPFPFGEWPTGEPPKA